MCNMHNDMNDIKKVLATRIKLLRKKNNLTQEELAFLLDISRTYLASLETAAVLPSLKVLVKIKEFFKCSYDYLLNNNNFPEEYKVVSHNLFDIIKESSSARFDDFEVTEEEKEIIIGAIKHALSILKLHEKNKK